MAGVLGGRVLGMCLVRCLGVFLKGSWVDLDITLIYLGLVFRHLMLLQARRIQKVLWIRIRRVF